MQPRHLSNDGIVHQPSLHGREYSLNIFSGGQHPHGRRKCNGSNHVESVEVQPGAEINRLIYETYITQVSGSKGTIMAMDSLPSNLPINSSEHASHLSSNSLIVPREYAFATGFFISRWRFSSRTEKILGTTVPLGVLTSNML